MNTVREEYYYKLPCYHFVWVECLDMACLKGFTPALAKLWKMHFLSWHDLWARGFVISVVPDYNSWLVSMRMHFKARCSLGMLPLLSWSEARHFRTKFWPAYISIKCRRQVANIIKAPHKLLFREDSAQTSSAQLESLSNLSTGTVSFRVWILKCWKRAQPVRLPHWSAGSAQGWALPSWSTVCTPENWS